MNTTILTTLSEKEILDLKKRAKRFYKTEERYFYKNNKVITKWK